MVHRDGKMTAFKSNAQHFETYEQALAEKQAFPFWNCMDLIEAGLIDNEAEYDRIWHICKV